MGRDRPVADANGAPGASGSVAGCQDDTYRQANCIFDNSAITGGLVPGSGTLTYDATLLEARTVAVLARSAQQLADSDARPSGRHLCLRHMPPVPKSDGRAHGPDRHGTSPIRGRRSRSPGRRLEGPGAPRRPTRRWPGRQRQQRRRHRHTPLSGGASGRRSRRA